MVYWTPYNGSGPGGCGLIHAYDGVKGTWWSVVDNHFDNCGVSIYRKGIQACVKVQWATALIEVTSLHNHYAGNTTVERQYNVDVTGWTQLYPTT